VDDLGTRIRTWRKAAGIRSSQLAKACGVTPSAVSQWEGGETKPSATHLERIAVACGVSLRIFFGELPPDEPPPQGKAA
jgi:transcriptional regulator with XRE-family HTH domain